MQDESRRIKINLLERSGKIRRYVNDSLLEIYLPFGRDGSAPVFTHHLEDKTIKAEGCDYEIKVKNESTANLVRNEILKNLGDFVEIKITRAE